MTRICIIAAKRMVQGKFMGALAKRSAVDLAVAAGRAAIEGIDPASIDQVIVGNVLSAGLGMNVARQVAVKLGLPICTPAYSVNMMCASGMQAILLAAQAIRAGDAKTILCGGTESMSNAPYLLDRARGGYKLGDGVLVDSLLRDGLVDAFDQKHMGLGAEQLAAKFNIDRAQQDAFAAESQRRYAHASAAGVFDAELVTIDDLQRDEHPRNDTTIEKLATLKPVFRPDGTITAGNSSGINDGAAMVVVCDEQTAKERGYKPLAIIAASAAVGCEPQFMGLGPVHATKQLCDRLSCGADAFDLVEINEAFAVQTKACIQQLELDEHRVNPHGGAIALGHPIGASGARIVVHLAHQIAQGKAQRALATTCVGGGMGTAVALGPV